jgi:hypothetical protein
MASPESARMLRTMAEQAAMKALRNRQPTTMIRIMESQA